MESQSFAMIETAFECGGIDAVLDSLEKSLREDKRFHELFECLKMKIRHKLDLPLLYSDAGEELQASKREELEEGLIEACREVGTLLLDDGQIREGWTYLRPVGDKQVVRERLRKIEATDDNIDQLIEVCLHESVDLEKGFQLLLSNYGTCNSITTFESSMYGRPRSERAIGARLLVAHVHAELLENIVGHIEREEATRPAETTIGRLVDGRDWLTADGSYHIDVTHLSSAVRIARDVTDEETLRLAFDLTEYGRRLDSQLQYPGDEPFVDAYESHAYYFAALVGEQTEQAINYFKQKAEACVPHEQTTAAIEVYVDLLHRLGQTQNAIETMTRLIPTGMQTTGQAPSLLELCEAADDYSPIRDQCRANDDLLGFTMGLLKASASRS